jgi:hypothetical protein
MKKTFATWGTKDITSRSWSGRQPTPDHYRHEYGERPDHELGSLSHWQLLGQGDSAQESVRPPVSSMV